MNFVSGNQKDDTVIHAATDQMTMASAVPTSGLSMPGDEIGAGKNNALREQGVGTDLNTVLPGHYAGPGLVPQENPEDSILINQASIKGGGSQDGLLTTPVASPSETEETDKTDLSTVTNEDFLGAIFGSLEDGIYPFVCGFEGSPHAGSRGKWAGQAWKKGETDADGSTKNWYFTLATYHPDATGGYKRRKSQFHALHGIMLDDLGSKAAGLERLEKLPPSWVIETSPGNHQAGYLFIEPLEDSSVAKALIEATIAAGLCDKGASGPLARYGRLPMAVNGKREPFFKCRLVAFNPKLRYTPQQIIEGLELEMVVAKAPKPKAASALTKAPDHWHEVYSPRASSNPIVDALETRGLYKKPLGGGRHDVSCPWVHEHTGEVDDGAAYFEPDDDHPVGGFKCHHGHCAGRNISDLVDFLGIPITAARHKATIRTSPGALPRIVSAAEQELARTRRFYQRSGQIVQITVDPSTQEMRISPLGQAALGMALGEAAIWERFDSRSGRHVPTDPQPNYVNALHGSQNYRHLPILNGLARQPYLRKDGSLMRKPGYDPATGFFGVFDESAFRVSENPTRAEAEAALNELQGLLADFSFAEASDKSAALAAMLTASIRPSLPKAPMFHVKAPQIASGKSYLTELISGFATSVSTPATSFPSSDEECRKLLVSALMVSPAVVRFDNLTTDLMPHKTLCSTLTDEHFSDRVLGSSKTVTVSTRTLFLSSGNNVDPIRDMARRCVTIRLDPRCEKPAERDFKGSNPVGEVRKDRGRFVSLALTIIRAWMVAGRPKSPCKPLSSFEEWGELIRQPLMWLGHPDPATSVFSAMAADPDRETLGRLLALIHRLFKGKTVMVRDIVGLASSFSSDPEHAALHEVLSDIAEKGGRISQKKLGWWITRREGRIVDDMKFERVHGSRNASQWRVVSVSSVSSVSSVTSTAVPAIVSPDPMMIH